MIVLCITVASGSALGFSYRMTPEYEAKAKVFVGPRSVDKGDAAGAIQELTFSGQFVASYAEILRSRPLAEKVVEKTQSGESGEALAERITTRVIPETRLIEVSVIDVSPERAQAYANETVNIFVADPDGQFGGSSGRFASVFEPALLPTAPVSPKPLRDGVIAGLLGAVLGIGIVLLIERLDTAVRNRADVERAIAPLAVIAQIPLTQGRTSGVFIQDDPDSPQAEAMRILRTNIQFFSVDEPVRTALITSPFAGEGKTTVSVNLAASIAAIGSTALLIETDLRKPVLHQVLGVDSRWGLSNVLAGQIDFDEAVQKTHIPNLFVLTAGSIPPNPSELLGSQRMVQIIQEAEDKADTVILDTSPALPVTDSAVLAPHADGVVLVVRSGRTSTQKAVEAIKNFQRHEVRVLGVVINGYRGDRGESDYYGYHYYRQARKQNKKEWSPGELEKKEREFLLAPTGPASRPKPEQPDLPRTQTGLPGDSGGAEQRNVRAEASHNGAADTRGDKAASAAAETETWIDPASIMDENPSSIEVYSDADNEDQTEAASAPASAPNPGEFYSDPVGVVPPSWPPSYYSGTSEDPAPEPSSETAATVTSASAQPGTPSGSADGAGMSDAGEASQHGAADEDDDFWEKPARKPRAPRKTASTSGRKKRT